jgi:hypothetical protein
MRFFRRELILLACVAVLTSFGQAPKHKAPPPGPSALNKATLEAYVRHLFVWGNNIKVTISDPKPEPGLPGLLSVDVSGSSGQGTWDQTFLVSKDGRKILRALVYDVTENPFQADLDKLKTEGQPSLGKQGAPVVLVEFTDFECPFCKQQAITLRQNLLSAYPDQVRLYFVDFPLSVLQNQASFWDYHDWVYEHQSEITPANFKEKLLEFAKEKGIDTLLLGSCLDTRATEPEVDRTLAEGAALHITGTPTTFINGRRLEGQIPWPSMREIIDYEIEYQKTAKNAGEDCDSCLVKLPSPLGK